MITMIYHIGSICSQEHFKVELEAFSPSDQLVIGTFKDRTAPQFLAKDISGQEVSFEATSDKINLLWFWSTKDKTSMNLLPHLNLLLLDELDHMWIYGFGVQEKETIEQVAREQAVIFSMIPSSGQFGEMVYGGDLGSNRLFLVDKDRIVREVLPSSFFTEHSPQQAISIIRDMIQRLKFD